MLGRVRIVETAAVGREWPKGLKMLTMAISIGVLGMKITIITKNKEKLTHNCFSSKENNPKSKDNQKNLTNLTVNSIHHSHHSNLQTHIKMLACVPNNREAV